jgi:hypothetical protein
LLVHYEEIVTSGQKIAVSLLTTVVIFACFTVAAFAGLFSQIEARFYEPSKIAAIQKQLDAVSESNETYINTLLDRFGTGSVSYVRDKAVSSYLSAAPADADVLQRTKVTGMLFSETPGLDGIRLVDANGRNVHFSTYMQDVLKQTDTLRMYKNYDELKSPSGGSEFTFESVAAPDSLTTNGIEKYRIKYDGNNGRLIFSFPFYDSYSAYRGTMLFYVNAQDFVRTLVMQNLVTINSSCVLVSAADGSSGGFVFGMPDVGRNILEPRILLEWQSSSSGPDKIVSASGDGTETDEQSWILISGRKNLFMRISGVYRASLFVMPGIVQVLLLICVFITSFLIVFMIFSLRHDDIVVIRDRIRRLQFALINEYLENRESIDWNDVLRKISDRRQDVSDEIKKSLGYRAKKHTEETDALINRSWDDIIDALSSRTGNALASPDRTGRQNSLQDQQEIRRMLEEILHNGSIKVQSVESSLPARSRAVSAERVVSAVQNREPAEEAEPLEEIPEAEPVEDVEPLEEIPEAEPAEETVEPEEQVPAAGGESDKEADGLEEIPEAEPVEDVEPLEEIPEAEPAEEVEPLEEVPEAEPVEETVEPEEQVPAAGGESDKDAEGLEEIPEAEEAETERSTETVSVDEFINSENKNDTFPSAGDFMSEPLKFGEPERKIYHPKEADRTVENFSVSPAPDFSFLDEKTHQESKTVVKDDAMPTADEDVTLESFGIENEILVPEELHETPGFSFVGPAEETEDGKKEDDSLVFDLEPVMPDFDELNESEDVDLIASAGESGTGAVPEDVRPLADEKDASPFVFTRFGANNDNVYELTPVAGDAIIEDKNGLFSISPDIAYTDIVPNPAFKKLVDSVLR